MRKLLLSLSLLTPMAAMAQAVSTMDVAASVDAACEVQASQLAFGTIGGVVSSPIDAIGNVNLLCSPNTPFTLSAAESGYGTGNYRFAAGLNFSIYTDAGRTTKFGGTTNTIAGNSGGSGVLSVPVYARIPAGQAVQGNGLNTLYISITVNY